MVKTKAQVKLTNKVSEVTLPIHKLQIFYLLMAEDVHLWWHQS